MTAPEKNRPGPIGSALLLAPLALAPIYLRSPIASAIGFEPGPLEASASWTLALDQALFGACPIGTLGASAALHLLNVFLLLFFVRNLGAGGARALWLAGLYAVHPIGVSSIAWSGGRSALLACGLALVAMNAHIAWVRQRKAGLFAVAWLAASLAAVLEPSLMVLPLLLLALESHALEREGDLGARVIEKLPLFLSCGVIGWFSSTRFSESIDLSFAAAPLSVCRAFVATLQPFGSADPTFASPGVDGAGAFLLAGLGLTVGIGALCVWRGRRHGYAALAGIWFLAVTLAAGLLPTMSWPHVGPLPFAAAGLSLVFLGRPGAAIPRWLRCTAAVAVLSALIGSTHRRYAEWSDPATVLQGVVGRAPNNTRALEALGTELCESGRLSTAYEVYVAARERNPEHAATHRELGYIALRRGLIPGREFNFDEAREHLEEAARLSPRDGRTLLLLGEVHQRLGDHAAAREAFEAAAAHAPESPALVQGLVRLAMVNYELGAFDRAAAHLKRALAIDPRSYQALSVQGTLAFRHGDNAAAEKAFLRALEIEPDYSEASYQLGRIRLAEGDSAGAEREFLRAVEVSADLDSALFELAQLFERSGRINEAIAMYRRTVTANPRHVRANLALGRLLLEQGEFKEAGRRLRRVLRLNPAHAEAQRFLQRLPEARR